MGFFSNNWLLGMRNIGGNNHIVRYVAQIDLDGFLGLKGYFIVWDVTLRK